LNLCRLGDNTNPIAPAQQDVNGFVTIPGQQQMKKRGIRLSIGEIPALPNAAPIFTANAYFDASGA
jgi:hypothetical protein